MDNDIKELYEQLMQSATDAVNSATSLKFGSEQYWAVKAYYFDHLKNAVEAVRQNYSLSPD